MYPISYFSIYLSRTPHTHHPNVYLRVLQQGLFPLKCLLYSHLKKSCNWNPNSEFYLLKPFSFSRCGASYSKQNFLTRHVRYDCGRTLICDNCDKTFLNSNSLYRHKKLWCRALTSSNLCDRRY